MKYPQAIQNLINYFSRLPTVGPKTAERFVFYLLKENSEELQKFAQAIAELKEKTTVCKICHAISDKNPCEICADKKRDVTILCIVANSRDMLAIESIKEYNGYYHILGGLIDSIKDVKPENLFIDSLLKRIQQNKYLEIILALNATIEGETTAMYLQKILKSSKIKISRLAKGLPTGADLEYADDITLTNAIKFRNII